MAANCAVMLSMREKSLATNIVSNGQLEKLQVRSEAELTVGRLLEVDVGVAERPASDHVPADPDREDGSSSGELLEEHGLGHVGGEITDIEGGHRVVGGPGLGLRLGQGLGQGISGGSLRNGDDGALHLLAGQLVQNDRKTNETKERRYGRTKLFLDFFKDFNFFFVFFNRNIKLKNRWRLR